MSPENIVIVGAGLSGLRVAEKVRRNGYTASLTLVSGEEIVGYDRPPLSKQFLTDDQLEEPVHLRAPDALVDLDLDLRVGVEATGLDTTAHTISLSDGSQLAYDRLVIATGVRARRLPRLVGPEGTHTLRTWADLLALRKELGQARHATVIGAGVLGCEIASSARARGVEVTLLESLEFPLVRVMGAPIGAMLTDLHRTNGVDLRCGVQVHELDLTDGRASGVRLSDGTLIETDLIIVAAGAIPNTEWLADSTLAIEDGVLCDRTATTTSPDVLVTGDIARMPHPSGDGTVRLEHWTTAGDLATLVAKNVVLTPEERKEFSEVPYFWSDQHGVKLQCLGLPRPEDDFTVVDGSLEGGDFLALYSRDGVVTGAASIGQPAALARCRVPVSAGHRLEALIEKAPWARRPAPTT